MRVTLASHLEAKKVTHNTTFRVEHYFSPKKEVKHSFALYPSSNRQSHKICKDQLCTRTSERSRAKSQCLLFHVNPASLEPHIQSQKLTEATPGSLTWHDGS
jgi:hypothetical protein